MWYLEKDIVVSSAHRLDGYDGKCANLHGHSWHITVYCKGDKLNKDGILVDFVKIKDGVNYFDHTYLNDLFPKGEKPTAENLAKRIYEMMPLCYKVMVQEEEGSKCYYTEE